MPQEEKPDITMRMSKRKTPTSNQRICDTKLLYAFYCALHSFIIKHLKGMVFERIQLINGNLLYLFALFFLPRFFGGKNIIVAVQTDV